MIPESHHNASGWRTLRRLTLLVLVAAPGAATAQVTVTGNTYFMDSTTANIIVTYSSTASNDYGYEAWVDAVISPSLGGCSFDYPSNNPYNAVAVISCPYTPGATYTVRSSHWVIAQDMDCDDFGCTYNDWAAFSLYTPNAEVVWAEGKWFPAPYEWSAPDPDGGSDIELENQGIFVGVTGDTLDTSAPTVKSVSPPGAAIGSAK